MAQATFAANQKIVVKADSNPKRKGTKAAKTFRLYAKAGTVAEFLELGGTRADIAWDAERGFIKVLPVRTRKAQ